MTKKKIILFLFIIVFFGIGVLRPYIHSKKNIRSLEENTAKGLILEEGRYSVGKDIKPGVYDIICMSKKGEYSLDKFDKNEKVVGKELFDKNDFEIDKGTFKLVPTSFEPLRVNEIGVYELIYSGNYTVGEEIPAGDYKIYVQKNGPMNTIQASLVDKNYSNGKGLIDTGSKQEEFTFGCIEDQIITINFKINAFKEEDPNIKVILEPQNK